MPVRGRPRKPPKLHSRNRIRNRHPAVDPRVGLVYTRRNPRFGCDHFWNRRSTRSMPVGRAARGGCQPAAGAPRRRRPPPGPRVGAADRPSGWTGPTAARAPPAAHSRRARPAPAQPAAGQPGRAPPARIRPAAPRPAVPVDPRAVSLRNPPQPTRWAMRPAKSGGKHCNWDDPRGLVVAMGAQPGRARPRKGAARFQARTCDAGPRTADRWIPGETGGLRRISERVSGAGGAQRQGEAAVQLGRPAISKRWRTATTILNVEI